MQVRAEIIAVGDEVLRGETVNTNSSYIAAGLAQVGYEVYRQSVVGDVPNDIWEAVRTSLTRSHITILTGGLGPTDDDLTKETIARSLGSKLVKDEKTAAKIADYFKSRGLEMTHNNEKQAYIIEGSITLDNPNGTAPGMFIKQGNQAIVLLPGPPREMEPMFDNEVKPRLREMCGKIVLSETLRVFGIGESALEEQIKDLLYGENPHAALYAKTGEVHIRIVASGASDSEATMRLRDISSKLRERLGDFIYTDEDKDLNQVVVDKLIESGRRIALAESCTGGLMAARITEISGSSQIFEFGCAAYADWVKRKKLSVDRSIIVRYGAVSSATAAEMAKGAMEEGKADIGVGITGVAGPTRGSYLDKPVGLIYIAVCDKEQVIVKQFNFGDMRSRDWVREVSTKNAFDMVRRLLGGLPIEGAKQFGQHDLADIDREGKPKTKGSIQAGRAVMGVFAAVLIGASAYAGLSVAQKKINTGVYNKIKSGYTETAIEVGAGEGIENLIAQNSDTIGWISISDSGVDGVVVKGTGDDYYTTHDFKGNENRLGCIYSDSAIELPLESDNLVLHGSSSDSGQMFGPLLGYTKLEYIKKYPEIVLETTVGEQDYRIVSVYYANSNPSYGDVQNYAIQDVNGDGFNEFVIDFKMRSLYNMPVDIVAGDRFLTLVTDIGDWDGAKLVIVARQERFDEADVNTDGIERNMALLYPDRWYTVHSAQPVLNEVVEHDRWLAWISSNAKTYDKTNDFETEFAIIEEIEFSEQPLEGENGNGDTGESSGGQQEQPTVTPTDTADSISVKSANTGIVYTDSPLNIVSMIVEAEVGSSFCEEAIKAQAVATITYLKYSYRGGSMPVVALKSASQKVKNCVSQVINMAMYYNGSIIYSPYFASAAGRTNACSEVYVQNLPYLVSVESKYDYLSPNYNCTYTFTTEQMRATLETYYEITLSSSPENWIQILDYTSGGYVGNVSIDGQYNTTGSRLRSNCLHLRSAAFTLSYDAEQSLFTIVTSGYGHGVGMSQYGANYYAQNEGLNYDQILWHYYTGVTLSSSGWTA